MDYTTPPPADQPAPPPPAPAPQRSGGDGFFDAMRRIGVVRTQERWIGGVAGGIALRFGIDPLLVRGIFGVTALFGGAGLVIYGLAWALLPEQIDGRIHLQETLRGRFDIAVLGAIGMFIVGISRGDGWFGWWGARGFGWLTGLLWFAAIAALVALVIAAANQRGDRRPPVAPQGPWTGGPGGPQHPAAPVPPAPGSPYAASQGGYGGPPAGAYAPAPGGYGGPPAGYVPVPPVPPRPPKPRVHGPGAAAVGAVVGLTLLALAVLLVVEREGRLDWPVALTAAGIGIVLAGLGIIVAGLRGRSSGTLGFLAVVTIVLAVPAAVFTQGSWTGSSSNVRFVVSDGAWAPTSATEARKGVAVAVGDVNVDLTGFPIGDGAVRVPVNLGAGDLTVTVPRDTAVTADVQLRAGDIRWEVDDAERISGVSGTRSYDFASNEVNEGASPELVLQIDMGAGQVRVVEEN